MVRFLGRQYGKLMRASRELRRAFILEADRIESEERAELLQQRKKEALERLNSQDPNEEQESIPQGTGTFIPFADPQPSPFPKEETPAVAPSKGEELNSEEPTQTAEPSNTHQDPQKSEEDVRS